LTQDTRADYWYRRALTQLALDRRRDFEQTCAEIVNDFGDSEDASDVRLVCRVALLSRDKDRAKLLGPLVTRIEQLDGKPDKSLQGAALVRSREFAAGLEILRLRQPPDVNARDYFFAALAEHSLGNASKARELVSTGNKWLASLSDREWVARDAWQRVEYGILAREVEEQATR